MSFLFNAINVYVIGACISLELLIIFLYIIINLIMILLNRKEIKRINEEFKLKEEWYKKQMKNW